MGILVIILFFIGIFVLQIICGLLYAILEKVCDKKDDNIIQLWADNVEAMWNFDDTCGYYQYTPTYKDKDEEIII